MAVETNARIEFSVASVEEWEKVNPKLHQGEPVFAKKPSGKYILKVGAPGGSTYKNAVVVWDQDDAETKMTSTQEAAAQALASKNAASASASAAKSSENAAAASKSAAATSAENAKTSETNAAASKTAAANGASIASAKATAAGNSASAAATSEKNAASSANAASNSESNALKSASAANTSAGNAKVSETKASASASAAKASENAAAKSAEAAKTFDPSSYYKKKEVDRKIEDVWYEPLNWDQLENQTAVKEGRLIVYDTYGNPWLLEYNFLQYLINNALDLSAYALKTAIPTKTSQLTNDSNFAVKSDLPTKTSQLTNDSGFAQINNGHLVINGSELWIE